MNALVELIYVSRIATILVEATPVAVIQDIVYNPMEDSVMVSAKVTLFSIWKKLVKLLV